MKKIKELRGRGCALLLALLLPLVNMAPSMTLVVSAQNPKVEKELELETPQNTIGYGDTYQITIVNGSDAGRALHYESNTPDIATVDSNSGLVTAIGVGDATITVTASESEEYTKSQVAFSIEIVRATCQLELNETTKTLTIGDEGWNTPFILSAINGSDKERELTFSSEASNVAEVNKSTGEVTPLSAGTTIITATALESDNYGSSTAEYELIIKKQSLALSLTESDQEKTFGDDGWDAEIELSQMVGNVKDRTLSYELKNDSDNNVASVDSDNGKVRPLGVGTATIVIKAAANATCEGAEVEYTLSVKQNTTTPIELENTEKTVTYKDQKWDDPIQIEIKNGSDRGRTITYDVDDPAVALVNGSGVITPQKAGKAVITVTANENEGYSESTATYTLIIEKRNKGLELEKSTSTRNYGAEGWNNPIQLNFKDGSDEGRAIKYTSSNLEVATINAEGKITPLNAGTTTITVTATTEQNPNYEGATTTYKLTISPKKITSLGEFEWKSVEKVYDGENEIEITGTLKEAGIVKKTGKDTDSVEIVAKITTEGGWEASKEASKAACYNDKVIKLSKSKPESKPESEPIVLVCKTGEDINNNYVMAETFEETLTGAIVKINHRPVYIEAGDCKLEYGQNIAETIKADKALIKLANKDGYKEDPSNEGLLKTEDAELNDKINKAISNAIYASLNPGTSPTVGKHEDCIVPNIYEGHSIIDTKYELSIASDNRYKGTLTVEPEVVSSDEMRERISVNSTEDGSNGIYVKGNDNSHVWVRGKTTDDTTPATLKLNLNDRTYYNQIFIENGSEDINAIEDGITYQVDASGQCTKKDLSIYLKLENNKDTRTISGNEDNSKATKLSEFVYVDAQGPAVEFEGMKAAGIVTSLGNAISFGKYEKKAYTEKLSVSDGEGSGVKSYGYYILKVENDDAVSAENIKKLAETVEFTDCTNESEIPVAKGDSKEEIENNYVVLVKAVDNVNNAVVYASNGLVVDITNPSVTLDVKDDREYFDGDVDYTLSVNDLINGNDEDNKYYSGLKEIKVEVTSNGKKVAGTVKDGKIENSVVIDSNAIDEIKTVTKGQNTAGDSYSLNSLKNKSTLSIDGKIAAEDCNSNNVTITVTATDQAGNEFTTTKDLKIDITKPTIDITYDNNTVYNETYFSSDRTMTIKYTERNFDENQAIFDVTLKGTEVYTGITIDGLNALEGIQSQFVSDTQADKDEKSLDDKREVTYTISFDGGKQMDEDYVIVPHVTDKATNKNTNDGLKYAEDTQASQAFTVDKIVPTLDVKYYVEEEPVSAGEAEESRLYENKTVTAVATINERNFAKEQFSQNPKQMNLNVSYTESNPDQDAIGDYAAQADTLTNWQSNVDTRTQTFTFDKDANYSMNFTYRDLAGNEVYYGDHFFTVDKTAPNGEIQIHESVWHSFVQVVSFGFFENISVGVTMKSDDVTAGVATQQYYKYYPDSEARNEFDSLNYSQLESMSDDEWTHGSNFSIDPNEQVIPYEKIIDRSGNVTYLNATFGVITDNVSPEEPQINITVAEPAKGIYNSDVPFHISVTEPTVGNTYAGLQSVSYEVRRDGAVTQSGNYDDSLSPASSRVKNLERDEVVNAELNNSNMVTIYVKAVDNAGNTTEATKDLKIDITRPTIQVTYDNNSPLNSKYYKDTRTATVTVTDRNFDEEAVRFNITNTDGTQPSISGWSSSSDIGVSDNATSTCQVSFSADGDYTFTLNCTDLAGNDSEYTQIDEFTIDKTIPTISVSYDNNSAQTQGYYKESRTATITINEHNFNAPDVQTQITAALESQGVSTPGVGGWSTGGDTHTATISYVSDADYTFDVSYSDMAGNAAADYTQDSFTIDKTKPTIEIFDIEDKSANNGTVAPGVNYSDTNFTPDGVKITIKGYKHNEDTLDGTRSSIANGQKIKMADFAHEASVDDVYTLTAQVTDKAGNTDKKSVIFSVNRFGSNYVYMGGTEGFLQKYYNNEEQDIIVQEINVDTVEATDISYGLDGNRVSLQKGADYTVKKSGDEVSWKSYTYTMNKANFAKEGTYAVTIDSKDRAKNEVNNKVKNKNIEFVIDKTKPTIVIAGVEDDAQYKENSRDISVTVEDNVALNSADIYLDGNTTPDKSYSADMIKKLKGQIAYTINNNNNWQTVSAVATDAAGNTAQTEDYRVLITSNLFVQYYSNKPLLFGSLGGVVVISTLLILTFGRKKNLLQKRPKKS